MKTTSNPNLLATLSLLWAGLLAGCANDVSGGMQNKPTSTTSSSGYYNNDINPDGSTTDNGYNCPAQPNVMPDANSDATFTDRWKVCKNVNNTSDIEFSGTATESQVCVFPAETLNSEATAIRNPGTGLPWFQCVAPSQSGAYLSFQGVTYNAVFIVEFTDAPTMQSCLYSSTYYNCPPYSYGEFRN